MKVLKYKQGDDGIEIIKEIALGFDYWGNVE